MGRDRFCCLRRMITGLATMTVERLNARDVLNTRMTLVVDPSMNHHLAAVHWSMLNRSRAYDLPTQSRCGGLHRIPTSGWRYGVTSWLI